jgi:hypothetical protein
MLGRFVVATDTCPGPLGGGVVVPPPIEMLVDPPLTIVAVAVDPVPAIETLWLERWPSS